MGGMPYDQHLTSRRAAVPLRPDRRTRGATITLVDAYHDLTVVRWHRSSSAPRALRDASGDFHAGDVLRAVPIDLFTEYGEKCIPADYGASSEDGFCSFAIDVDRLGDRPLVTIEGVEIPLTPLMRLPWLRLRPLGYAMTPYAMVDLGPINDLRSVIALELYAAASTVRIRHSSGTREVTGSAFSDGMEGRIRRARTHIESSPRLIDDVQTAYTCTRRSSAGEWEAVSFAPGVAVNAGNIHVTIDGITVSGSVPWRSQYTRGQG